MKKKKPHTATSGKLIKEEYASFVYVYIYCTGRLEYNYLFLDLGGCGERAMSEVFFFCHINPYLANVENTLSS